MKISRRGLLGATLGFPLSASNQPFTHRRYILAAAFGQAAQATGEPALPTIHRLKSRIACCLEAKVLQ